MTEQEYNRLDQIVAETFGQIVAYGNQEEQIAFQYINIDNDEDMAIFHIGMIVSSMINKPFVLDMGFFDRLKLKWKSKYKKIRVRKYKDGIKLKTEDIMISVMKALQDKMDINISDFALIYNEFYKPSEKSK